MIAPDEVVAQLATFAGPAKRHPGETQAAADERRTRFLRAKADELWSAAYKAGVASVPLPVRPQPVTVHLCDDCLARAKSDLGIGPQAPPVPTRFHSPPQMFCDTEECGCGLPPAPVTAPVPFDHGLKLTRPPHQGNEGAERHRSS